jgi:hypothetical protein
MTSFNKGKINIIIILKPMSLDQFSFGPTLDLLYAISDVNYYDAEFFFYNLSS